jgi:hypothetical protein
MCRRHLARFDRADGCRRQYCTLLGLVHNARRTPFGVEHDFARIRSLDDFRRLVPPRTAAELERFPVPPVSANADAARRSALTTALALVARERPHARLFDGTTLLLGDDVTLPDEPGRVLPRMVQPFANVRGRVTCLIGSADRLVRYLEVCRADDRVTPAALLYTPSPGVSLEQLKRRLNPSMLVMELAFRPEAAIAIEEPRHGLHRLLTDHGVFFEFVPAEARHSLTPPRVSLDRVDTGAAYELVVSAPGGWWACRTGVGVRFEHRDPSLLRFVPLPVPAALPIAPAAATTPIPARLPHPRTSGIPAALPESFVHTPW